MNKFSIALWVFLVTTTSASTTTSKPTGKDPNWDLKRKECTLNDYDYKANKTLPTVCKSVNTITGDLDLSSFTDEEYSNFFPATQEVVLIGSLTIKDSAHLSEITLPAGMINLTLLNNEKLAILRYLGSANMFEGNKSTVFVAGNRALSDQSTDILKQYLKKEQIDNNNFYVQQQDECNFHTDAIKLLGVSKPLPVNGPWDLVNCELIRGKLYFDDTYPIRRLPKEFDTERIEGCVHIRGAKFTRISWLYLMDIKTIDGQYGCGQFKIEIQDCYDGDVAARLYARHGRQNVAMAETCTEHCSHNDTGLEYDLQKRPDEDRLCKYVTGDVVLQNRDLTHMGKLNIETIMGTLNIHNCNLTDLSFLDNLKNVTCDAPDIPCVAIHFNNIKAWKMPKNLKITNRNPLGTKLAVYLNRGYTLMDADKHELNDKYSPLDLIIGNEAIRIVPTTTTTMTPSSTATTSGTTTEEPTTTTAESTPTMTETTTEDSQYLTALEAHNAVVDARIKKLIDDLPYPEYLICMWICVSILILSYGTAIGLWLVLEDMLPNIIIRLPDFGQVLPDEHFEIDARERIYEKYIEYLQREREKMRLAANPQIAAALEAAEAAGLTLPLGPSSSSSSSSNSKMSKFSSNQLTLKALLEAVAEESAKSLAEGTTHTAQDHKTISLEDDAVEILETLDETFSYWESKDFMLEMIRLYYEDQDELFINREFDFDGYCEGVTETNREFVAPKRYYPNENTYKLYRFIPEKAFTEKKKHLLKFHPETHIRHFFSSVKHYNYSYEYVDELLDWCLKYRDQYNGCCFHKEIKGACNITGDVHGSIRDLQAFLSTDITGEAAKVGMHPMLYYQWLFCGDIMDRSSQGLDVVLFLLVAGIYLPNIHILRGNHDMLGGDSFKDWLMSAEAYVKDKTNVPPGSWLITDEWKKWKETKVRKDEEWAAFKNRYHEKIDDLKSHQILLFELLSLYPYDGQYIKIHYKMRELVAHIPLTATVNKRIFCAHGGFGWPVYSIEFLKSVPMPFDMNTSSIDYVKSKKLALNNMKRRSNPYEHVANAVLWSDPHVVASDASTRNSGHLLDNECILDFLQKENIDMIVRGHQNHGYQIACQNRCVTVYCSKHIDQFIDEMDNETEKKEADLQRHLNPAMSSAIRVNRDGSLEHILIGSRFEKLFYVGSHLDDLREQCCARRGHKPHRMQDKDKLHPRLHFDDIDSGPLTEMIWPPSPAKSEKKRMQLEKEEHDGERG